MDSASHICLSIGAPATAADSEPQKNSPPNASSSSTQGRVRPRRRRLPLVRHDAGNRDDGITVEDLGLPLGMSFAAVLSKVLDGKNTSQEQMHVDQLSKICGSAVKESLQNIYGERFDHFVRNFEKSFGSTLQTLRLVNKAFVDEQASEIFMAQGNANCSSLSSINSEVVDDLRPFVSFSADEELHENLEVNSLNSELGCVSSNLAGPKFNHSMLNPIEEQENTNCSSISSSNCEVVDEFRSPVSSSAVALQGTLQVNSLNNQLILHGLMNQYGCVSNDLAGPKFNHSMLSTIEESEDDNCSVEEFEENRQRNQLACVSNGLRRDSMSSSFVEEFEENGQGNQLVYVSNGQRNQLSCLSKGQMRDSVSSSSVEEFDENEQENQLVCASNGQRNQLSCVSSDPSGPIFDGSMLISTMEKSIVEQRRSNDLKTAEIHLTMKKLEMKQSQLSMSSYSIYLDKIKIRMGISKASFKEEKLSNQMQNMMKSELLKTFNDLLLSGTFCMLFFLACGIYIFSYEKVMMASSACLAIPEVRKGWSKYIWPNSLSLISSTLRCQIHVYSHMMFGLGVILAAVYFLLQRPAATSGQTMPLTVLMILGVACGYAGKFSVDMFGGRGLCWILYWEALCLIHFFANVFPAAYHYFLYGPVSVSKGQPKARIIPYRLRRYTVYCILVLILPALCGLLPFARLHDWRDYVTQNLSFLKDHLTQNLSFSKIANILF